jgi:hypothetical protein
MITDPENIDLDSEESQFTDWANEPKISELKQDLSSAQSDHDTHVTNVNRWLDNLNVTGTAKVDNGKNNSSIVPKLIRKQAEWRYAALSEPFLSTDDIFNTSPVTYEDKTSAIQNGLVLNNQFNTKIQKTKFIDEYVRAAVDEGTVIVRVGWDSEEEIEEVEVPIFEYVPSDDPQDAQIQEQLHGMMQQDPVKFKYDVPSEVQESHQIFMEQGIVTKPIQVGSEIQEQIKVIKNCPTVEVCNFNHVIVDPTCLGDLTKAGFIIYYFDTSLSELKKDGKYTNLDKIEVSENTTSTYDTNSYIESSSFTFKDKPRQKLIAYEYWGYWDINDDGIVKPIVATWVGNTLIRMEENPFPDQGLPFVSAQYLPVRKAVYGEPDGELLEDNQKIIGAVTRGMIDIMGRSANGQMGSRKDALDVVNKRKFDSGKDYEFNAQVDPRMAFHMHTFPEIPQSAQYMINMQNAEAESLTGVKAFSSGISGQALGNTATGIRSALDATSKRELGILRRLAEGIKQIGRKFISMNSEFLSEEEIVRITNEEFVVVKRDDLAGNIDIKLSISTAEADEHKAQELAFMLQTMGNTMPPEMAQIVLTDIAKLRKMPDLAKQIENYKPQPDPIAQEKAQLELELLKAQIANENAKAHENTFNGELDKAKIQTELAKASNMNSDTDLKNLDFVEQESGTKHERDRDRIQSQADGNIALKAVDNDFKMQQEMFKQDRPTPTNI